ncbi:MAG: hypothetical protein BWX98_02667 [Candidatus Aminicenantes bacterium ADurb.Bin147]|nr:MAG: hypothetical protein BWX98_02667 [Candidatus Aminicenantes bacterium ADurb.Bin147]
MTVIVIGRMMSASTETGIKMIARCETKLGETIPPINHRTPVELAAREKFTRTVAPPKAAISRKLVQLKKRGRFCSPGTRR